MPRKKTSDGYVRIPIDNSWRQISGDMDPGTYGAVIARSDGDQIELIEIQPVREAVGDDEATDVGFPFWSKTATYDLADLDPNKTETRSAIESVGLEDELEDMEPEQRALAIAEALLRYGYGYDEGPAGWSTDVVPGPVAWWGGKIAGAEYLADEDESFREEILDEGDDDEDEDEDEDEDDED